ncbi:MAG: beta-glycosidase [Muribaculaceae bacterium]|nr:beta-glycosidase [Muribaculaceae bacterium]
MSYLPKTILAAMLLSSSWQLTAARDIIDLSGEWSYILVNAPAEIPAEGVLSLPGTLDTNNVGIPVPVSDNTSQLSRKVTYTGNASYSRDISIPESWSGKSVILSLERTRPATVFIDGKRISSSSLISAPQLHDLSGNLPPGKHTIEIVVNNGDSIPLTVRNNSHACTESTQTNWNGIIGKMQLTACDPLHIVSATPFPQPEAGSRRIDITLSQPAPKGFVIAAECGDNRVEEKIDSDTTRFSIMMPASAPEYYWSEWNPQTEVVRVSLHNLMGDTTDEISVRSALRDFKTEGNRFYVNGHPAFLRGRHDACVFPSTAHVPMDYDAWKRYFDIVKEYGLNHVRFHSWCPPEECFRAADDAGIYLQPELPIWGELDKDQRHLMKFLDAELNAIIKEYSHHPSFTMFALGNELWGDISLMKSFLEKANEINPNLLVTYGSNIYLGWKGHLDGEDFLVTCRVGDSDGEGYATHARASFSFADAANGGLLNSHYPNSQMNFSHAISLSDVPVIGHETGQYQIYPDFNEIMKYDGVLRPDNLQEFARRAAEAGNMRKTRKFFKASGEWAARLYRADMEMNLRTPGMGGFQLLDLQDYPGQGTALVGILDAFMDSKGIISPDKWRESCDRITLLAELPKFCFTSGESVTVPIKVANFSAGNLGGGMIDWSTPFAKGQTRINHGEGLVDAGEIRLDIPETDKPVKMSLEISSGDISNSYDIWIYPRDVIKKVEEVIMTKDLEFALSSLARGEKVILCPDTATVKETSVGPLFTTDYWNYRMFRSICDKIGKEPSPGTLGLLINNRHEAFNLFPTDFHTDWQWFAIVSNSHPIVIDRLPKEVDPIVEVIDNVERNYRLALMLECNVGKGKLMIISADMDKAAEHPEGKWLLNSVKEYMASKKFKPDLSLTPLQVRNLLTKPTTARIIKDIRNESYDGKSNI